MMCLVLQKKCLSCEFMIIAPRVGKKGSQLNYVYFSVHAISVLLFILNVTAAPLSSETST